LLWRNMNQCILTEENDNSLGLIGGWDSLRYAFYIL
jgi:hypothetical protein